MSTIVVETLDESAIYKTIQESGVCVIPHHLIDCSQLTSEASEIIQEAERRNFEEYSPGVAEKLFVKSSIAKQASKYPKICDYFSHPLFRSVFDSVTNGEGTFCEDIYMTKEVRNDRGLARNGYLHFDRNWAFKVMVYLSDVTEGCGPFSVVPGSHDLGRSLRQLGWEKYKKYGNVPNRSEVDLPDVSKLLGETQPIYGKAGTVILFDTDIFHLGGLVETGKHRWIIRSHCRSW